MHRTAESQSGGRLAQVDRPTERAADLTDRPLPTLERAVALLRIARRTGDRQGVRLFSRLIDRILDAAYTPAPTQETPDAEVVELHPAPAEYLADWTAADFDSYEVLASTGTADPAAAVTAARGPRSTSRGCAA